MSDTEQTSASGEPPAPGWWLASDGNWYPPQDAPAAEPPVAHPQPQPQLQQFAVAQPVFVQPPGNGLATAGMVIGIIAVCFFFVPFLGIILGALALIFGAIGISNASKGKPNRGRGVAGVVLGVVALSVSILWIVAVVNAADNTRKDFTASRFEIDATNSKDLPASCR